MKRPSLNLEILETRQLLHGGALGAAGEPAPALDLVDQNPTSPTYNQSVTSGDLGGNYALYFLHSG